VSGRALALAVGAGLGLALAGATLGLAGCGTCRPGGARVEPRVGGGVSVGSGGTRTETFLGLDLSNLFCRPPEKVPSEDAER